MNVNVNEMEMTLVGWTCEHRKLVERANEWLQQNMGVCEVLTIGQLNLASLLGRGCDVCEVLTCETVTWCAVNPQSLGDSEQMALSTSIEQAVYSNLLTRGQHRWRCPPASNEAPRPSISEDSGNVTCAVPHEESVTHN